MEEQTIGRQNSIQIYVWRSGICAPVTHQRPDGSHLFLVSLESQEMGTTIVLSMTEKHSITPLALSLASLWRRHVL